LEYISLGYFKHRPSRRIALLPLPHQVNPSTSNAEATFGMANALLGHFADKLPVSRLQPYSRTHGAAHSGLAIGHSVLSYGSLELVSEKSNIDPLAVPSIWTAPGQVLG